MGGGCIHNDLHNPVLNTHVCYPHASHRLSPVPHEMYTVLLLMLPIRLRRTPLLLPAKSDRRLVADLLSEGRRRKRRCSAVVAMMCRLRLAPTRALSVDHTRIRTSNYSSVGLLLHVFQTQYEEREKSVKASDFYCVFEQALQIKIRTV